MHRVASVLFSLMFLISSICFGQSLADAARENRTQKAKDGSTSSRVFTNDDISAPADLTIHLVPGGSGSGVGTLTAPGSGKHRYFITDIDASQFLSGGTLHITITLGPGPAEASFDLFPQGFRLPTEGMANSLAHAYNVRSGTTAKISYRFDHGTVFQLAAEGSWNAKAGDTNSYNVAIEVAKP